MINKLTVLSCCLIFALAFSLQAQTMDYKSGYKFPVADVDSVLSGLASVRGSDLHPNPLGNGVAAFAVTNYNYNGYIHVFKNSGNDSMELVWTSPEFESNGGGSHPRFVKWGDLDNDGTIELIAPFDGNGIAIFEWDGVADSWNFGDAPARIIANPLFPVYPDSAAAYHNVEFMDIDDIDGDGQQELVLANNSTGTDFDRYYIFSISGQYATGNPGFSVVTREGHWPRNDVYANYGGGTPYGAVIANLDGEGSKEIIFHNWNYGHVTPVRSTGFDTYELADTTGGSTQNGRDGVSNHFIYGTYPTDAVSLGGGSAYDIDGDGREEVYIPLYSAPISGDVMMVHYEEGDDLSKIDSTNIFHLDLSDVYGSSSLYGRPGIGDFDDDQKPNLYFAGRHNEYIVSSEFQGGDKTDPANWVNEIIYTGDDLDSKILRRITTTTDSDGIVTIDSALQEDVEGTIAMKISANYSDFDNDGFEDIIMPSQAWTDSIDVNEYTWIRDTAYTIYDTMYANTDSMAIDTVDFAFSIYDSLEYKIEEPVRVGIRFLESSVMATGLESRDLTVITPKDYKLRQNYPNPFNPETTIEFVLPIRKKISLTIYNSIGQKVKTLINDEFFSPGSHEKLWDGTNDAGVKVATGMYVYELSFGNFTKSRRMMLIK
jgi:hypothetical protein